MKSEGWSQPTEGVAERTIEASRRDTEGATDLHNPGRASDGNPAAY